MNVRKIAVLRANALGDFIFSLPALEALKKRFPDAELVYMGRSWHAEFLRNRPSPVDRVIVIPKAIRTDAPLERDVETEHFLDAAREESFDIAFQMHGGGGYSNPLVRELQAKVSIGLQAPGAAPLDINVPYRLYMPEVLRYLEVAACAGANPVSVMPRIRAIPADHESLAQAGVPPSPCVVLHPGATDLRRRWSPENFAVVGDWLARSGFTVCVTGAGDEQALTEAVTGAMHEPAVNLCNCLDLGAMAALLEKASLVVSNDTGPLHLARALRTPAIGIYWIGNVITGGSMTMKANRNCISWQVTCPNCHIDIICHDAHVPANGCDHAVSFVDGVSPEEVLECASELLQVSSLPSSKAMNFG